MKILDIFNFSMKNHAFIVVFRNLLHIMKFYSVS